MKYENMEYYNKHRTPPPEALKEIKGGRMSGKTDINPMWRIKALTEMFGPVGFGWYYKTTNKWIENSGNEGAAFVDIELFVKIDGDWSMPIPGTGGSMFVAAEKNGPYVSDECYKMATTDAISVACKQLGIAADIYWSSDRSKYDQRQSEDTKPNNPKDKTEKPQEKANSKPNKTQDDISEENLEKIKKMKIAEVKITTVYNELNRTGKTEAQIEAWLSKNYHVAKIADVTEEIYPILMQVMRKYPDKAV